MNGQPQLLTTLRSELSRLVALLKEQNDPGRNATPRRVMKSSGEAIPTCRCGRSPLKNWHPVTWCSCRHSEGLKSNTSSDPVCSSVSPGEVRPSHTNRCSAAVPQAKRGDNRSFEWQNYPKTIARYLTQHQPETARCSYFGLSQDDLIGTGQT